MDIRTALGNWRRPLAGGVLLGLCLAMLAEVARIVAGGNFHVVIPGQLYRCAQPSPAMTARLVRDFGIQTMVNLRGTYEPVAEYQTEHEAANSCHVRVIDAGLWSCMFPSVAEACRLLDALDSATPPVLLHCLGGCDRTGLAATMFLLLHTDADLLQARRQMSLWYGHFPFGSAAVLDRFIGMYETWLTTNGQTHSAERLRWWVRHEYRPPTSS